MEFEKLFSLNNEVLDEILGKWLPLKDLVLGLDNAITNHVYRKRYLQHLQNSHIVSNSNLILQSDTDHGEGILGYDSEDAMSQENEEDEEDEEPFAMEGDDDDNEEVEEDEEEDEAEAEDDENDDDKGDEEGEPMEEEDEEEEDSKTSRAALNWFKSRGVAIENIDIYDPITSQEIEFITAKMVDQVRNINVATMELDEMTMQSVAACKNLTSLTLDVNGSLSVEEATNILQNFKRLENLTLEEQTFVTMDVYKAIKTVVGSHLQFLMCWIDNRKGGEVTVKDLFQGYTKLKYFNMLLYLHINPLLSEPKLTFNSLITLEVNIKVAHAVSFHCPNVENLFLIINSENLRDFREELDCNSINHDLAKNFRHLKYLQIANDIPSYHAISFFNQRKFPSLVEIAINGNYGISNKAWYHLIENCENIEIFTLKRENHALYTYQDEGYEMVISYFYGPINELALELHDDELVNKLCINWPKLQDLKLCGLLRISDKGLLTLCQRQDTLTSLHFTNPMETVSSEAYKSLSTCGNFKHLTLRKCGNLTDEDFELFLKNNPKLEKFNVSYCPKLTSNTLSIFAQNPNRVKELNLSYNKEVYDLSKLKELVKRIYDTAGNNSVDNAKLYLRHIFMHGINRSASDTEDMKRFINELSKSTGISSNLLFIDIPESIFPFLNF